MQAVNIVNLFYAQPGNRSKTQKNEIVIIFNIFWSAKSFVLSQMQITPLFYIIYESYKKKS